MFWTGRFGDAYLLKIWGLTVLLGPVLSSFFSFIVFTKDPELDQGFFIFIFVQIAIGIFLSLPSFLISEFFYKFLSKSNLSNHQLFAIILGISILTAISTYFLFFGRTDDYMMIFSTTYSIVLIFGFFYFKKLNLELETRN